VTGDGDGLLRELRLAKGLSVREAARRAGLNHGYLSQLERGKVAHPKPQVLRALASVYGEAYGTLMAWAGYGDPDQASRGPLLTPAELALVDELGVCYLDFRAVLYASDPASASGQGLSDAQQRDLAEFAAHVHDLQHAVMARAAVRAYPDRYRP
jgi:transcriptional regulator with XRE-family HTH domain